MKNDGIMSFSIPKGLIREFRNTVKKSGYTQRFLVSRVMEEIIKELKAEQEEKNEKQ